jgi:hypothetical protein
LGPAPTYGARSDRHHGCMNIFEALRVSHETQRALSARLLASEPDTPERHRVFVDLKRELLAHETAEERCFYVPLIEHDATVDAARHAIAEHHEMDEMVEELEGQPLDAPRWMAARRNCARRSSTIWRRRKPNSSRRPARC